MSSESPPQSATAFHQVLILVALAIFGGGGTVDLPKLVKKSVAKGERREVAVKAAEGIVQRVEALRQITFRARRDMHDAVAPRLFDSTALDALFTRFDGEAERVQAELLDLRFEMRDAMTPEEWTELFRRRDDAGT